MSRHRYGKTAATVRTTGLHGSDAILDKAKCGVDLQHRPDVTATSSGRQSLLWKLRTAEVQPSGG